MEGGEGSRDAPRSDRNGKLKVFDQVFSALFAQLPNKLQNHVKFDKLAKDTDGLKSENPSFGEEKGSSAGSSVDLEKQLQAWRENPSCDNQPPEIKDKDSWLRWSKQFCGNSFGGRGPFRFEFLWIKTEKITRKHGIHEEVLSGGKGRIGSKVRLNQLVQPAIVPPPPISCYIRGITAKTTEMLVNDLLAEAARLTGGNQAVSQNSKDLRLSNKRNEDHPVEHICNIKERWNLHRRNAKQHRKKLLNAQSF
ncbi:Pantothenate kinase 2 [Hibiscus syriacus]|uniref:Pantothenate kinase 2 n=1 Tax=Hibiscus syriacus TaxID=106335 RepID=A0A6A3A729_HIBSY|nr:Pantothenate kinase 2 [Hibiscus syriacus]